VFRVLIAIGQTPFDPTSGAAQATLHLAELLAGCACEVRCLATSGTEGVFHGRLPEGEFSENGVRHSIIPVDPEKKHSWHHLVGGLYDRCFDDLLSGFRPDFVLTFGDEPPDQSRRARALAAGSKVVFCLHNESYRKARPENVTAFLSPSDYLAEVYHLSWGERAAIAVLPTPMTAARIIADTWEPVFVTFVNPQPAKGLWFMIRFAEQLGIHHPEIPLRIIEGRATAADFLAAAKSADIDLSPFENLFFSTSTADVREIWATTRILLAPAVWNEPAGRTPVEAMMNGAVPIVSNRGGLAGQLNSAGRVLPLPEKLTLRSSYLPTADEVAPWTDAVVGLCRDDKAFQHESDRARHAAERYSQACLAPRYLRFLQEPAAKHWL
jgi:glycosyltransferase involved in cell wall biosynthesis